MRLRRRRRMPMSSQQAPTQPRLIPSSARLCAKLPEQADQSPGEYPTDFTGTGTRTGYYRQISTPAELVARWIGVGGLALFAALYCALQASFSTSATRSRSQPRRSQQP
jgi:hypothetical protein